MKINIIIGFFVAILLIVLTIGMALNQDKLNNCRLNDSACWEMTE